SVYRLLADFTRLNVVVHPGVGGQVTLQVQDMAWDEALDRMLAPNGLAASHVGPVLEIGLPERLGTRRDFTGRPGLVDFKEVELPDALRQIAADGGRDVVVDPSVAGHV